MSMSQQIMSEPGAVIRLLHAKDVQPTTSTCGSRGRDGPAMNSVQRIVYVFCSQIVYVLFTGRLRIVYRRRFVAAHYSSASLPGNAPFDIPSAKRKLAVWHRPC